MKKELEKKFAKVMHMIGRKHAHSMMKKEWKKDSKAFENRLLAILEKHPDMDVEKLAERFGPHGKNVETLISKLEKKELLIVGAEDEKGRRPIALTEKGKREAEDAFSDFDLGLSSVWESFSQEEQELLERCFNKIEEAIKGEFPEEGFGEDFGPGLRGGFGPGPGSRAGFCGFHGGHRGFGGGACGHGGFPGEFSGEFPGGPGGPGVGPGWGFGGDSPWDEEEKDPKEE